MVDMRRYLLVLDTDLLALDEELNLEPINYLVEQQEQEPCEVVVLSPVDTAQAKQRRMEILLWGGASNILPAPAQFPTAARPGHDANAAAEHRMNLTVRHLTAIGCQASGVISDEDLVQSVEVETRSHHYHEVILAISGQNAGWLARTLHRDPIHHLQRRWGAKLTVFSTGPGGTSAGNQDAG